VTPREQRSSRLSGYKRAGAARYAAASSGNLRGNKLFPLHLTTKWTGIAKWQQWRLGQKFTWPELRRFRSREVSAMDGEPLQEAERKRNSRSSTAPGQRRQTTSERSDARAGRIARGSLQIVEPLLEIPKRPQRPNISLILSIRRSLSNSINITAFTRRVSPPS